MKNAASSLTEQAVTRLVREDWGRLVSSLNATLRDLQLAEDCLQDAVASALEHWGSLGIPDRPSGWLLQVARRKAIDRLRRDARFRSKQGEISYLMQLDQEEPAAEPQEISDEWLRMIFTCCHPAIEEKARVALTLRTLGGLTTGEIASAFLDREPAMAQRLVRAKQKIAKAGIPYEVPGPDLWEERLASVLDVLYLIFNEGYAASSGAERIRIELCEEALRLIGLLDRLTPAEPEIEGLRALMMLHHARRAARHDDGGTVRSLEEQDRSVWDHAAISEGIDLATKALERKQPGPFQIQAAIAALHAEAESFGETDWVQIAALYSKLQAMAPNPVVLLNLAVAKSYAFDVRGALSDLEGLEHDLNSYVPYHAARADMLCRLGETDAARNAYRAALSLCNNSDEQGFFERRMRVIDRAGASNLPGRNHETR